MMRFTKALVPALAALCVSVPGMAQTNGPVVNALTLERQLELTGTLTTKQLAFPPDKAQGILSGALLVRERLIYNPSAATITSTLFVVQPGSVLPTPINADLTGSILAVTTLHIEKIYSTTNPANSLSFTGTVGGSPANGILGNVNGLPFTLSMAYTNDTPAKVSDVVGVIAGRLVVYTESASGVLDVPKPPTPPTPGNLGPQISIVAPAVTIDRQITLDASATTDDSGTSLMFAWKSLNKSASILNPNTPVATVQFGEGLGEYSFELTVTNGKGFSAKKTISISYFGR